MNVAAPAPALRDVPGPSALGGGTRRFLTLTWLLSSTEFKLNYFGTAFGYALLLFNIMLYQFFAESTTRAVGCVVGNENVVRKMQFPRLVIPVSVVLTGLFNLGMNLIAVFIFLLASGVEPRATWLVLPLVVLALVVVTAGVSVLLSALYVRFRDVAQIWGVAVLVVFYGSPILYPVELIPHGLRFLLFLNPFAPLLEEARRLLVDPTAPTIVEAAGSSLGLVGPLLVAAALCAIGLRLFTQSAPQIAEQL
jgi:ABC-2 type transport system permease protein